MTELSDKVLKLTTSYIGPASQKFLERQTTAHMNGLAFNMLQKQHLPELSRWVSTSAGLLINTARAQELAAKIAALT